VEIHEWEEHLKMEREQKNTFFSIHPQSPIPSEERGKFKGLDYYPPNLGYRLELKLHEHPKKERIRMSYTKGEEQGFVRWGEFRFKIGGREQVLQAYKSNPDEDRLFVPFRDATSGTETYGAGRYLDLEPESDCTLDGKWVLDFNKAYNPWCAYSENYTCPFVPPENWLEVPIHAGEKKTLKK
jgi:uncharacterized protein (DUF1684 family)